MRSESERLDALRATIDDPAAFVAEDLAEALDALTRVRSALTTGTVRNRVERAMSYVQAARNQHGASKETS